MVLVKEATMNHRIRTAAAGVALLTAGLTVGLAIGSPAATATEPASVAPITLAMPTADMDDMAAMMTTHMADMADMGDPGGMAAMMDTADTSAMHPAMHQQMADVMDADLLAACDTAHAQMADTIGDDARATAMQEAGHEAHHVGTGS
jgi:hypothetical protein